MLESAEEGVDLINMRSQLWRIRDPCLRHLMSGQRMGDDGENKTGLHLHLEATVVRAVLRALALPERSVNKAFSRLPSCSTIPANGAACLSLMWSGSYSIRGRMRLPYYPPLSKIKTYLNRFR